MTQSKTSKATPMVYRFHPDDEIFSKCERFNLIFLKKIDHQIICENMVNWLVFILSVVSFYGRDFINVNHSYTILITWGFIFNNCWQALLINQNPVSLFEVVFIEWLMRSHTKKSLRKKTRSTVSQWKDLGNYYLLFTLCSAWKRKKSDQ